MARMKIIKNIFKIHFLTYLLIIISIITGRFKTIILFMFIIVVHELGHFLIAKLLNWKIDKIYIYPLGGLTKFKESINKPFHEELLVTIMGPIFQIIVTILLKDKDSNILLLSNFLLIFNLLPIVPLDGGKLLNLFLSAFIPYNKSIILTNNISCIAYLIVLFFAIYYLKSIFFIIIIILLIIKLIDEIDKKTYYFNRFLLERYLYKYRFKRNIIIKSIYKIYKYKNNYIIHNNRLLSEEEFFLYLNNVKKR